MKGSSPRILVALLLIGVPAGARADVVHLKHGGKLEGRIVERTESSVRVDIGAGSLSLPMSSVARIEEGRSPLDDFDERAAELTPDDLDGWLELARWASSKGLGSQSLRAYGRVLAIDPDHPEANRARGRVNVDGRWMTEDEAYRARGYVRFEGRWVTPGEQESILRAREADREAERARARADEAEARAREAEARAEQPTYGAPLYWTGWGPGPQEWPSNPLDPPGRFQRTPRNP